MKWVANDGERRGHGQRTGLTMIISIRLSREPTINAVRGSREETLKVDHVASLYHEGWWFLQVS
jgi:hypothetical protein